jgi:hypothetical protein
MGATGVFKAGFLTRSACTIAGATSMRAQELQGRATAEKNAARGQVQTQSEDLADVSRSARNQKLRRQRRRNGLVAQ